MTEAYHRPIAAHDCSGPMILMASVHPGSNAPNTLIQETVCAFCSAWYQDLVTEIPRIVKGYIYPPEGPG